MKKNQLLFLFALGLSLAIAGTAHAKNNMNHGNGKNQMVYDEGNGHGEEAEYRHQEKEEIRIRKSDRARIESYFSQHHKSNCPPGLAKKHNGCLPPGQAKKLYQVGHRLPDSVAYELLPSDLLSRLGPAPMGHRYIMVDKDILLMSEATHNIVDAITLLSAVGKQ